MRMAKGVHKNEASTRASRFASRRKDRGKVKQRFAIIRPQGRSDKMMDPFNSKHASLLPISALRPG